MICPLEKLLRSLAYLGKLLHDNLQRARHILNDYESKLHLVAQYEAREQVINELKDTLPADVLSQSRVQQLLTQMEG